MRGISVLGEGRVSCRFCASPLELTVVDLGMSPLCESFLRAERIEEVEPRKRSVIYLLTL